MPMLYMLINCGLQSGLSIAYLKLIGELFQSGEWSQSIGMLIVLSILMVLSAVSQTHSLNMAMKEYD